MAKRTTRGYGGQSDDDDVADAEARRAKAEGSSDYTGEDDPDEADTKPERAGPAFGEQPYQVVDPGTVIDGIYYPKADAARGQEMTVFLSPDKAQALADGGVKLTNDDDEPVEPTVKEEEASAEEVPEEEAEAKAKIP
jgi:hypothetical protein